MSTGDHFEGNTFGPMTGNVGSHGTFIQQTNQPSLRELDDLLKLLREHLAELPQPEAAMRTAEEVRAELATERPRRDLVSRALTSLAGYAGSLTVIVDAIENVRRAVSGFLT